MEKILHIADPASGGGGAGAAAKPPTIADLQAQNAALQAENEALKAAKKQLDADEAIITAKMAAGLTRPQAIAVIQRQREHDKAIEAQWAARRPDIIAILKGGGSDKDKRLAIREINPAITTDEINAAKKAMTAAK